MGKIIVEAKEFLDKSSGHPFVEVLFSDGSREVKNKTGYDYPKQEIPKTEKELYSELSTDQEKINFISEKLGLQ